MLNEQIANNLKNTLIMEWYGIRMESTRDIGDVTYHYISVPESSTIETKDQELNKYIQNADGLIAIAKDLMIKMALDTCRAAYKDMEDLDDFMKELKEHIGDLMKVYAKVREGEVWTQEMGEARVEELIEETKKTTGYKEV